MMGKRVYVDITIRGVTYPDAVVAAAAHGVTPATVRRAAQKGTLHRVGTARVGPEPMPVRVEGRTFPDVKAAAAHFGKGVAAVYAAIEAGDPDRLARPPRYNPARSRPFAIGGLWFRSMRAASRELGFGNPEYIATALKRRSKRGQERILAAAMAYAARREAGKGA